jgi:membrane fusion protein (multidrug efflux system)
MPVDTPKDLIPSTDTPPREGPEKTLPPEHSGRIGRLASSIRTHPMRAAAALLAIAAMAIAAQWAWYYFQSYESTDDAQIDTHISIASPRVNGTVIAVHTDDNQVVQAGQVLIEIDPRDYQARVAQARADLAQAMAAVTAQRPNVPITSATTGTAVTTGGQQVANGQAALAAAEHDYDATVANLRAAEATNTRAQADLARYRDLVNKDEVSRQQYDTALATATAASATVDSGAASAKAAQQLVAQRRAALDQALTQLSEAEVNAPKRVSIQRAELATREANVRSAEAQLEQALLNLSYCKILAPVSGVVGRRTVEVGNRIQPGEQLLYITQLDDLWVTANFKETQLSRMKPGQRAVISVDALGGGRFEGYVESMPGASGARFSLLPPENATGNYVKVVQRLPVRIRLKPGQDPDRKLRPGMSVGPKVWLN